MKITIPEKLPSLNEVINVNRGNKYAGANLKKEVEQRLCLYIKSQCKRKYERIIIWFKWYEPNKKRDYDNITSSTKFILDALVKSQVIPNDGWKQIEPKLNHEILYDHDNPRVEVFILEATTDNLIKYNTVIIKSLCTENEQLYIKRELEREKAKGQLELQI